MLLIIPRCSQKPRPRKSRFRKHTWHPWKQRGHLGLVVSVQLEKIHTEVNLVSSSANFQAESNNFENAPPKLIMCLCLRTTRSIGVETTKKYVRQKKTQNPNSYRITSSFSGILLWVAYSIRKDIWLPRLPQSHSSPTLPSQCRGQRGQSKWHCDWGSHPTSLAWIH